MVTKLNKEQAGHECVYWVTQQPRQHHYVAVSCCGVITWGALMRVQLGQVQLLKRVAWSAAAAAASGGTQQPPS